MIGNECTVGKLATFAVTLMTGMGLQLAVALTQQFAVPAENLSTQGYGKQYLKVPTEEPERANRRVTVRRITPLLAGQAQ